MSSGTVEQQLRRIGRRVLPRPVINASKTLLRTARRVSKPTDWHNLRTLEPVSRQFGYKRGTPIDRYYIEKFLAENADAIRGDVLEIANPNYTRRFGGDRVTRSDVLHVVEGNPQATIVGDLVSGENVPENAFDCFILTETLIVIYDIKSAVKNAYRALKPGGVLLVTSAGITPICRDDMDAWGDYWRFTSLSIRRLMEECFPPDHVQVTAFGNVLAATAFLHGVAREELTTEELDYVDRDFEMTLAVRAQKPADAETSTPE